LITEDDVVILGWIPIKPIKECIIVIMETSTKYTDYFLVLNKVNDCYEKIGIIIICIIRLK
jgi:hypothetical protein